MVKNLVIWALVSSSIMLIMNNIQKMNPVQDISYSQFIAEVREQNVDRVTIAGQVIRGKYTDGQSFETIMPAYDDELINDLLVNDVNVEGKKPQQQSLFSQLLVAAFPIIIMLAVFMFAMNKLKSGDNRNPLSFGRSKAKRLSKEQIKTTFADVAGCDEAKEDVRELVDFLRHPGKYKKLGGKIPRGVLMVGPPGTGKTLLAKAIAGEADVPFFSISGSDFVEMFVGVGASRVRDMFKEAKKNAPCIIFIDEIDAVGRSRSSGMGGNDEREQTLNQLLVEMDGFDVNNGVIVIAATNRADVLDSALLRPGRFDRQVPIGLPDIRGREQILNVHAKSIPLEDDVDTTIIARGTPGFSGAQLANLVNEASLLSAKTNKKQVSMSEFERARDKIMMGSERKAMVMSEKEKSNTAYHEAGHAIIGRLMPEHDPVYKVSIIPRGQALGVTVFLPEEDRYSMSKQAIESNICALYGGRIAEEMTLGKNGVTTGASNDIERATQYAFNYVTKWGLSDTLGAQFYSQQDTPYYPGASQSQSTPSVSEKTAHLIDQEVKKLLDHCYTHAAQLLEEHRSTLELMKKALMEYETIDSEQIDDIMQGKEPKPPKSWSKKSSKSEADQPDIQPVTHH